MAEQIERVKGPGFSITVLSNRIEITDKRGCMGFIRPKKSTIPIRSITSVDVSTMTGKLVIKTNDGKENKFPLGGFGGKAKKIQEAILDQM